MFLRSLPTETLVLPPASHCEHCSAKKFHLEPPNFCCSGGEISLVISAMPYQLLCLFTGDDEQSTQFRANIRSYNNHFAFTSLGAKYDRELTKNKFGMYTFRVQGQVYHFLNNLVAAGEKVSGIQFYFYDTEEEFKKRLSSSERFRADTLKLVMRILEENPYSRFFRDLRHVPHINDQTIVLNGYPGLDQRVYNLPSVSQVAAIFCEDEAEKATKTCHIQVYTHSNVSHRIQHYYSCYDPLQYPLLFPRGESGWYFGIERVRNSDKRQKLHYCRDTSINSVVAQDADELLELECRAAAEGKKRKTFVSAREYYCYRFQIRECDRSMLLHSFRLLQQFVVDVYVKIETSRLDFHRKNQKEVRSEILEGILDSVSFGETEGSKVGRRIFLPASFIGGPRDMRKRYLDAMALVQKYGKPDIFLTMTCNPNWKEIKDNLQGKEVPFDRPDLLARVFRAKFEVLKIELIKKKLFGEVVAFVYTIEFQKRGMPHAHMLLILKPEFKPLNPEAYDRIVCAELFDAHIQSHLYSVVVRHMVHGPCGILNKNNACMKNGVCKNGYPKQFVEHTSHVEDGYPQYRRRDDGKRATVRRHQLDNRWVVPYNPYLLSLFDCHMNVEICSTIKLVKYIYKYIYKGHDLVSFNIVMPEDAEQIDEIKEFQDGRWVGPPEAMWRIFAFKLNEVHPSVYTLQIHLQDGQLVSFHKNSNLLALIRSGQFSRTMLTEFFAMNRTHQKAVDLKCLYREFPQYFVWNSRDKMWSERKRGLVIGRMATVNPTEGDRYYLRILLSHVRGPTSYDDLLTVNGTKVSSFREAAVKMGLLHSDSYIEDTLEECSIFQMPSTLRLLFAVLLVHCSPNEPKILWERFEAEFSADYQNMQHSTRYNVAEIRMKVLEDINKALQQMGKNLNDYHLMPASFVDDSGERMTREIDTERNIHISPEDLLLSSRLNDDQKIAYDQIMAAVFSGEGKSFFLDGPGGTGKTFLYRALLATVRSQGFVAIAVATSGVAASILPGGRTAHSRFKIPLDVTSSSVCHLSKQTSVARLIGQAKLIVWDEATMARKESIEAFDSLLRDITDIDKLFGGKVVVFGGDFRQTLPVIPKATRETQVKASIINSVLWPLMHKLALKYNMRATLDPLFSEFLLRIGEGTEPIDEDGNITLPQHIVLLYDNEEESVNRLLRCVFTDLQQYSLHPYEMINRCILSPKNASVDDINNTVILRFPGELHVYTSTDRTIDAKYQADYEDFLNSLSPKGLPPHKLLLKSNCPVMLLRNLNPSEGLCNGTRLICRELGEHAISAEIATGQFQGKKVFLPRIPLDSPENQKHGIPFRRTQFPLKLCFCMTINKAQGQTLDYVGIYLREPVFSHGQLYVALSRARSANEVKVLIFPSTLRENQSTSRTRNVVFSEVFELLKR